MATVSAFGSLLLRSDRPQMDSDASGISERSFLRAFAGVSILTATASPGCLRIPLLLAHGVFRPTVWLTVVSFFNTLKYPPSLDYLLMTLGLRSSCLGYLTKTQQNAG